MKKDWVLTEDSFNLFLSWLDSDREAAAQRYEALRRRLVQVFYNRGCPVAEDLADETFNRVMRRLPEMIDSYIGSPAAYIHTTAHTVFLDYLKQRHEPLPEGFERAHPSDKNKADEHAAAEQLHACLERCLDRLTPENRAVVMNYYQENKQAKIVHRKQLAERLGMAVNALRIRLCRVRASLQQCIETCLEQTPEAEVEQFARADERPHEISDEMY